MRYCSHRIVPLGLRLIAVLEMLGSADVIADIGCDHGYLSAALLRSGRAKRVLASDISAASVEKVRTLAADTGLNIAVRRADGLEGLLPLVGGADFKIAVCGMGGELIAGMLERGCDAARRAELIVMQPMRGEAELRGFLVRSGYGIADERVVLDSGRYYQVIAARYGGGIGVPEWFPADFYRFGWVMVQKREPELMPLLLHFRSVYERELAKARLHGREVASLVRTIEATNMLIDRLADGEGI